MSKFNILGNSKFNILSNHIHNSQKQLPEELQYQKVTLIILKLLDDPFWADRLGERIDYIFETYPNVVNALAGPHGDTVLKALILRYNERRKDDTNIDNANAAARSG